MKIYIAGKINGDPNYQQKFMKARQQMEEKGHIVISPAVLPGGMTPGDYMKICFAMINVADAVAFLPDWKDSPGARLEWAYCKYINKETLYQRGSPSENEQDVPHWATEQAYKNGYAKGVKEFAEKIDEYLKRYSHLHKHAEEARHSREEFADGTPTEMVSVWDVLSLEKWGMAEYETMNTLQENIETIAKERLLTEFEKDFRLLIKEMAGADNG